MTRVRNSGPLACSLVFGHLRWMNDVLRVHPLRRGDTYAIA
jgi:hypothetical protein